MRRLNLTVSRFVGPREWDWSLWEAGRELGRHEVRIAGSEWQFPAFTDLFGHVGWRTTAATRRRVEPAVADQLGRWAADRLLGDLAALLTAPATVEVRLPGPAAALGLLPFEAVIVGDRTLALRRVTFTFHVCDGSACPGQRPAKRSPADPLRVLAVFSLPTGTTALALRRERVALTRLLADTAGDIELRVLQYGTTRESLRQACADPPGWDVVHVSGHGEAAGIMLETDESAPDPVPAADLVELLVPLRHRIGMVTLSACESAAGDAPFAWEVASRLDCSVLAMRFPVADEFAAALVLGVYDDMVRGRLELPVALGATLARIVPATAGSGLTASTPTIVGCRAATASAYTTRTPPSREEPARLPAPARFVGRVGLLARARRALAPDSGVPGVVFQGMTGAGKTTCARELADISAGEFDVVVWYTLPAGTADPAAGLVGFAEELDRHHGMGLRGTIGAPAFDLVGSDLADRHRGTRVLTVLDDAEGLLDPGGRWRTPAWRTVLAALAPAEGASRVVITSRSPVEGRFTTCVIDPLSRTEGLLILHELPRFGTVLEQRSPAWMRLVERVLDLAEGHPAVLELAEAQVDPARPDSFQAVLDRLEAGDLGYPAVLITWVDEARQRLGAEHQRLFRFLCCLEEVDRRDLLTGVESLDWAQLWSAVGGSEPIDRLHPALPAAGLVVSAPGTATVHSAVVAHVRDEDAAFVEAAIEALAGRWGLRFVTGLASGAGAAVSRQAAWRGLPYALRARDAFRLQVFADHILREDHSRATSIVLRSAVRPALSWADSETSRRVLDYLLAKIERDLSADPRHAMRSVIADALAAGDGDLAGAMGAEMFEHLFRQGDLDGAEAEAEAMIELHRSMQDLPGRLGLVTARRFRADVRNRRGRYGEALAIGAALLRDLDELAADDHPGYPGAAAHIGLQREHVLHVLAIAEEGNGDAAAALKYRLAALAELRRRGGSPAGIALAVYNTYIPLMRLGRLDEAAAAVAEARRHYERAGSTGDLARVLGAQGEIECRRGNHDLGADLVGEGLRHGYRQPNVETLAVMHEIYGTAASNTGRLGVAVAHLAAAAALQLRMGDVRATGSLQRLDMVLRAGGAFDSDEAATVLIERTVGAGFRAVARRAGLAPGALTDACAAARLRGGALPAHLAAVWDPVISALVAAGGDDEARARLARALAEQETKPDWVCVVRDLRALLDGGTNAPVGDETDVAIGMRARAALAGDAVVRANLWQALPIRELLATVVLGALGDAAARSRALAVLDAPPHTGIQLSGRFRRLLAGERDRAALVGGLDRIGAEVMETLLDYMSGGPQWPTSPSTSS